MDVHQWLDNTVDREPLEEYQEPILAHLQAQRATGDERPRRRYRRKRQPASSKSSIPLHAHHPAHHRRGKEARYTGSSEGCSEAEPIVHMHRSRDRSLGQGSQYRETAHRSYERRPRHKTKADRYELKRKREREHEPRDRPMSKRRRPIRSGDGGRTAGVVQAFQLKNGPKKSRLTLKPDTSGGLFRHGRASEQVAPRGVGLPDLTFNEMRFLQRPKEHQDDYPQDDRISGKKDRQHLREAEISAYFALDHTATQCARPDPEARRQGSERKLRTSPHGSIPIPLELSDKPFLGFGSKGRHATQEPTTKSHYTWSESRASARDDVKVTGTKQNVPPHLDITPMTEGGRGPSRPTREKRRRPSGAVEPSIRKSMPSEPPVLVSSEKSDYTRHSSAFHTSDILNIYCGPITKSVGKENNDPTTSTPTSKLLERAFQAVSQPYAKKQVLTPDPRQGLRESISNVRPAEANNPRRRHPVVAAFEMHDEMLDDPRPFEPARPPALRQDRAPQPMQVRPVRWHINTEPPNAKDVRADALKRTRLMEECPTSHGSARPFRHGNGKLAVHDQDFFNNVDPTTFSGLPAHIYANAQQAEALAHNPTPSHIFDVEQEQAHGTGEAHGEDGPMSHESWFLPDAQMSAEYIADDEQEEERGMESTGIGPIEGDVQDHDDRLAGFWKPNKLYW
ncbi:hypothetical protein LTR62_003683 [Meristemomyces frigidus]|uniref:Uncharacterized protein n=1 Tax=Meristemomyces frigidus TaxID=1508187 RepID=A0AAN7YPK2_9PEZI|nr:hypothetical protein LTR62_003683 [Meristemomyces frigidus]